MINNFFFDEQSGFLCYKPTKEDLDLTEKIYLENFSKGNLLNSSTVYDRKESRIAGILGEIVFGKYMGSCARYVGRGNMPFDFIVTTATGNKLNVDVKTKFRTVKPRKEFEASFYTYQSRRFFCETDYYVFLSTIKNYEYVWFCGLTTKDKWLKNPKGKLWKAGDVDPTNNKVFHKDTWSVLYKDIAQFPRI